LAKVIWAVIISVVKRLDNESQLPRGMKVWFRFHADSGRRVMAGTKRTIAEVMRKLGAKLFKTVWHVGLSFCGTQNIEKTMKPAIAYKTDIADLHRPILFPWAWLP
jgi:hypothetical protein